ncbi:hypothetical protein [Roseococcus thiosulfatophilus]|uniref:hypothetical protein n=1 Tax=Roseococcus thiosulfatophilus TaxID=35813 RepID=UPI001A901182|nr:hypothetical protein [Roseococcus thiosulfatophilus]
MTPRLLTSHQVAELLGLRPRQFGARRAGLEAAGFPGPVAGLPDRWDPLAIEAWLAAQRGETAAQAAPSVEDVLVARARAMAA